MPRIVRFLIGLLGGLGLLGWVASVVVERTTRRWLEHDLVLRSQLAVAGAGRTLVGSWDDVGRLTEVLGEVVRDERILAAAVCGNDWTIRAATVGYPLAFGCGGGAEWSQSLPTRQDVAWSITRQLPGGLAHLTAIPLANQGARIGAAVVVHDLSFMRRREEVTRRFIFLVFGAMAATTPFIFWAAARLSWRDWSEDIRRFLQGGKVPRPEFQPILGDVRDLIERLANDRESEPDGGAWTANRLKQTLTRHLHGEKVVILANREPYVHHRGPTGDIAVLHPASGLVSALEPVMRACSGTWIAHGSGSADRDVADRHDRVRVPPNEER